MGTNDSVAKISFEQRTSRNWSKQRKSAYLEMMANKSHIYHQSLVSVSFPEKGLTSHKNETVFNMKQVLGHHTFSESGDVDAYISSASPSVKYVRDEITKPSPLEEPLSDLDKSAESTDNIPNILPTSVADIKSYTSLFTFIQCVMESDKQPCQLNISDDVIIN